MKNVSMPKYKKRDLEFTAIQFTGSNIEEVMAELGPKFSTKHRLDLEGATTFDVTGHGWPQTVRSGQWIVVDPEVENWTLYWPEDFTARYEPIRRAGRPPKEKK